ncbi:DNA mismatch repair protein Msh6-1 [Hordeum vulgare]|nr:DNA mismatch repair protein Msh6-1 [Hordeum vulgare]
MDQVKDAPPSGTVESDYEAIADLRYKEMAASKGKAFPFKHVWQVLQTYDKWKLRDQETAPKKPAMLRMDDSEEEAWKELMVEEKEHMMMSKKDMDEDQLMWWKEYKEYITERKRIFRGASSTLRGDTPMSGGGDGGVEDPTTDDNGGA